MDTEDQLQNAQEFGEKISALIEEYKNKLPLTAMAKVMATIQIDIMAVHAAVQVAAALKSVNDETPEVILP